MEAPGERAAWLAAGAAGAAGGAWLWYRALGPGRRHSAGTRAADVRDMASGLGGLSRKQTGERMEKHKQFFYAQVRTSPPCLTARLCLPAPWSARAPARCSLPPSPLRGMRPHLEDLPPRESRRALALGGLAAPADARPPPPPPPTPASPLPPSRAPRLRPTLGSRARPRPSRRRRRVTRPRWWSTSTTL